jgi:hypothetical protein
VGGMCGTKYFEVLKIWPNYFYVLKINRNYCLSIERAPVSEAILRKGGKLIISSGKISISVFTVRCSLGVVDVNWIYFYKFMNDEKYWEK